MAKLTPLQEVKERFGSKDELTRKLIATLERNDDLEDDQYEAAIKVASNKQLLRMWKNHNTVSKRFGSKEKLVETIVAAKFPNGNDNYRDKLLTHQTSRLLDLHRQLC